MNESIKDLILTASSRMTENCHSMDFIVSKGNRRLPDRGSIIGILKDLRRLMFPGFFGMRISRSSRRAILSETG